MNGFCICWSIIVIIIIPIIISVPLIETWFLLTISAEHGGVLVICNLVIPLFCNEFGQLVHIRDVPITKQYKEFSHFHSIHNVVDGGVLQAMWELAGKVSHQDQLIYLITTLI